MATAEPNLPTGGPAFADAARLHALAMALRAEYAAALPFPHVVLDDFLPGDVAERLLRDFPPPEAFRSESSLAEPRRLGKLRSTDEERFSPLLRQVLHELCGETFLRFVSLLSGTPGLVSDGDRAGALRHYGRGGRLGVHVDGNFHSGIQAWRRVNLILYLNRDWQDAYGGQLELWDATATRCVARIAPLFNRAVLFDVHDAAYHGFPDPLRCPRGVTRKTIQLYYYTRDAPDPAGEAHDTLFRWRPSDRWSAPRLWHALHSRLRGWRRRGPRRRFP